MNHKPMISDTALAALAAEAKYQAARGASMFLPVVTVQLLIEEISLGRAAATALPKVKEANHE